MSDLGHSRRFDLLGTTSALPPTSDISGSSRHFAFGERPSERHQPDARDRSAKALPSTKSGLLQPFEHRILRLLRAELSGERPGFKEWP